MIRFRALQKLSLRENCDSVCEVDHFWTMAVDHAQCCSFEDRDATNTAESEFELDFDPTQNSCCRRDQLQRRSELRAKEALQGVDRVDLRTRLENRVLGRRPAEEDLADDSGSSFGDLESGSDDGRMGRFLSSHALGKSRKTDCHPLVELVSLRILL
jgi:hypothetical protein